MKKRSNSNRKRWIAIGLAVFALLTLPILASSRSIATSVTIVNNSNREIRYVYLTPVDADNWSSNQLSNSLTPGQSTTLNGVSCSQQQLKVIGEDNDGCFVSTIVTCGENSSWTITDSTERDCGN
ncbi:MAG: hypothetical protein ACXWID_00415 [Pyrinomonadaceae bacterium]